MVNKKPSAGLPTRSLLSLRRLLRRSLSCYRRSSSSSTSAAARAAAALAIGGDKLNKEDPTSRRVVVVDVDGWLLRSPLSTFPYFMLVAVEAGSFLRGLLLLLVYPVLCLMCLLLGADDLRLKAMAMVSFFGLREKEVARISKAVLPKFFLEDVAMEGLEAAFLTAPTTAAVAVTMEFPRVMVEGFLKEYLGVQAVVGREVAVAAGRYLGCFLEAEERVIRARLEEEIEERMSGSKGGGDGAVALVGAAAVTNHIISTPYCKETYVVSEFERQSWQALPRHKYPKELVFHDGRLAFRPTFFAAVAMYTYLPWGLFLSVFRSLAFGLLPYRVSIPLAAFTGMRSRLIAGPEPEANAAANNSNKRGRLYVCNHRTLLDPITVAAGLNKPVTAVTYSVSPVSELIAPIRTARLTRNRDEDRRRMEALLARGDLVVCPEGTTCREPYLLRFSPLFAELADEVTPVALDTAVDMFYGTSTKPGAKWLDPFYFMMNSRPEYRVEFLHRVDLTAPSPSPPADSIQIQAANRVQCVLGEALGFQLTHLTRKHKYKMLAGNEGVVLSP